MSEICKKCNHSIKVRESSAGEVDIVNSCVVFPGEFELRCILNKEECPLGIELRKLFSEMFLARLNAAKKRVENLMEKKKSKKKLVKADSNYRIVTNGRYFKIQSRVSKDIFMDIDNRDLGKYKEQTKLKNGSFVFENINVAKECLEWRVQEDNYLESRSVWVPVEI